MASNLCITLTQSSPFSSELYSSKNLLQKSHRISITPLKPFLKFQDSAPSQASTRGFTTICFSSPRNGPDCKGSGPDWPFLRRWDVPWNWQTVSLSSLACGLSFVLTGLIETASIPFVGLDVEALSLDEKAEILFADQAITTAVVLIVLYTLTKSSQPLPDDIYRYDLKEPFNLQRGWLLWAGIGLVGAIAAISLTGVAMSTFNGEPPQRETDALARLLPLIGSSSIRVPTPLAAVISGAVFALAHLTPGQFPQLFVLGTITATAPAPAPTTSCVKVDGCALDLITSVFNRRISLSTQCCQGFSTISDDCFYKEFTHSKRVPFFLGKVRNYCSHAVSNAASPTHVASSPDVVSPSNMAPSPAPTTSCIKKECAINLITSVFRHKILLSTQCCQVLSTISNDCFYRGFTHSKLQEGTVFPRQSERLLRCGFTNSCGSISIAGL